MWGEGRRLVVVVVWAVGVAWWSGKEIAAGKVAVAEMWLRRGRADVLVCCGVKSMMSVAAMMAMIPTNGREIRELERWRESSVPMTSEDPTTTGRGIEENLEDVPLGGTGGGICDLYDKTGNANCFVFG